MKMKMKRKALDFSTKLALAMIMLCSALFVSCNDDDDVDVEGKEQLPVYYIAGIVTDRNSGGALKGVKVGINDDYADATTDDNGMFTFELGAITPNKDGYTLTYSLNGYDTETKHVSIEMISEGISITFANIALLVTGTSIENPVAPPVEGADTTVSEQELEDVKEELNDKVSAVFTEEVKEELKNEIVAAISGGSETTGEITVGEPVIVINENGQIESTVPVTFEKATTATSISYPYTATTGFEVIGGIEVAAQPTSRAIGDIITDPTTIATFKKCVANELNMSEGFSTKSTAISYPVPAGYQVVGYKMVSRMETKKHTYLINGQYLSGKASTYTVTEVVPEYKYNGDSHDAHGNNPNAGGGSSI